MGTYDAPPAAVIFDIDGTLANCDHRRHHVEGKKKNFNAFYDEMGHDTIYSHIRGLCNMYYLHDWHVIICTGRPEKYRAVTLFWLKMHGVMYKELRMRPDERRNEADYIIKQDMLDDIRKDRKVELCFDDRQQVVDMWRSNGIPCMQVAPGDF